LASSANASLNWGIQVGVNANDPDAPIGQSFRSVAIVATGIPSNATELRIELHRFGDDPSKTYCARWTSSTASVALTSFNTACWDPTGATGTAFTTADAAKIDQVGFQIASLSTSAITVTNLCLESITFSN
jgi:hypothetical protein